MKNRILYLAPGSEIGGTERMIILLAREIERRGYRIHVVTMQEPKAFTAALKVAGLKTTPLNLKKKPFLGLLRFALIIVRERPGLIHSFLFAGNMLGKLAAAVSGLPLICSQRSTDDWKKCLHWNMERWTSHLCKIIISNSHAGKRALVEKGRIQPEKITVIPNGIDPEIVRNSVSSGRNMENTFTGPIIGSIGNLRTAKGFEYLLDAAKQVVKKVPSARFVILGEGSLRSALEEKIARLGLQNNVSLPGFISPVEPYLARFNMLVIPSLWEGFPVVALEAMCLAKPIVATRAGDLPEIIRDGISGILVDPGDANGLAHGILTLLADEKRAQQMGQEGYKHVLENYSLTKMVDAYEAVYRCFL
jgi:glycosyltransferase involved in cell wall biosynthesis